MKIKPEVKIPLYYVVFSAAFISTTDIIVVKLFKDPDTIALVSISKALIFLSVTATLLWWLIKKSIETEIEAEKEIAETRLHSIRMMHHILRNFLNKMSIFRAQAEDSPGFNKNVLKLYDAIVKDATDQIDDYSRKQNISA